MSGLRENWNSWIADSRGWYLSNDPEITFESEEEATAYCDEKNRELVNSAARLERSKIVSWLRDDADQVLNSKSPNYAADLIAEAIVECAQAIAEGEHLLGPDITPDDWYRAYKHMDQQDDSGVFVADSFREYRNFIEKRIADWIRKSPHFVNGHKIADAIQAGEYGR